MIPTVGTVVQLKSGGPPMTVVEVPAEPTGPVVCWWFEDGFRHGTFVRETLVSLDDESWGSVLFGLVLAGTGVSLIGFVLWALFSLIKTIS